MAILATIPAVAEPVVVPGEAFGVGPVAAALAEKCQPDCIVLNREDWTKLIEKLKAEIAKKNI